MLDCACFLTRTLIQTIWDIERERDEKKIERGFFSTTKNENLDLP